MPIRGSEKVRAALRDLMTDVAGPRVEKAITEALIVAGGLADSMTPVDLGTLINSRYRVVEKTDDGWGGRYGYTAAYAAAVHERTGKLKTNPPTPRRDFGVTADGQAFGGGSGKGNYWDGPLGPGSAEPHWLSKGFEEAVPEIRAVIKRNLQL